MPNCLRVDYALVSLHNSHWYCTFVGAGVVLALQLYLYWHCTCVGIALVLFLSSYLYWYCYCASLWRIVYLSLIIFQHSTIGKEMMDDLSEQQHFIGISFHAYCFDVMLITILTFILLSLSLSLSLGYVSLVLIYMKKVIFGGNKCSENFCFFLFSSLSLKTRVPKISSNCLENTYERTRVKDVWNQCHKQNLE